MNVIIAIGIILVIYLVAGGIGSYLLYDLFMECADAIKELQPEVYEYTSTKVFKEKPKWLRIIECMSIGYSPLHCFPSLKALLFHRIDLQNEFVGAQVEVAKTLMMNDFERFLIDQYKNKKDVAVLYHDDCDEMDE